MKNSHPMAGPLTVGAITTSDPAMMISAFDDAFCSQFVTSTVVPPATHQTTNGTLSCVLTTPAEIQSIIKNLKYDTSMGPDGIHPRLLKHCSGPLSHILCHIFNLSMLTGVVPDLWKISHVTPIFKKGSRSNANDHRPVSLSSLPCKIDERIIANALSAFCLEHDVTKRTKTNEQNVLSEYQFGFVKGRSVEDSLLLTYDYIARSIDDGLQCDLILFDFSKAFDKVSHPILLTKLRSLGITGYLLDWLTNFLTNRFMTTRIAGITGTPREVLSGVPQGSVLGPLLFIIFINFITEGCGSRFSIFADDLKMYTVASNLQECLALQDDINRLYINACNHLVLFNASKCAHLHFPASKTPLHQYDLNGAIIATTDSARDLGVIVDKELKFHKHVNVTYGKAHGLASNLLSHTSNRSPAFMNELYISHIRPLVTFASPVWNTGYLGDERKLEGVQRRWTREIFGLSNLQYFDRLQALNMCSIKGRLLRADLILCWKIFHGQCHITPEQLFTMSSSSTRRHAFKIFKPRIRTEVRRRSFSYRIITPWNNLPSDVVSASSLTQFKTRLHLAVGDLFTEYTE